MADDIGHAVFIADIVEIRVVAARYEGMKKMRGVVVVDDIAWRHAGAPHPETAKARQPGSSVAYCDERENSRTVGNPRTILHAIK